MVVEMDEKTSQGPDPCLVRGGREELRHDPSRPRGTGIRQESTFRETRADSGQYSVPGPRIIPDDLQGSCRFL